MKRIIISIAALAAAFSASYAQDFQTGYFMDDYIFAYKMNPALRPEKSFVSLPGIGGFSVRTNGNIGIDNLLFPLSNGKLGTFMHPEVSAERFLGPLSSRNKISAGAGVNILSLGIKRARIYHTLDISVRSINGMSVPYKMFSFLKEGVDGRVDIPHVDFASSAFVEAAYGASLKINDKITVGARIKGLVGLANAKMRIDNLSVTSRDGVWTVTANGTLKGAFKGVSTPVKQSDHGTEIIDIDQLIDDIDNINKPAGFGGAIDLGVTYKILPKLELSASITDFGGIRWKNNINGCTGKNSWVYDGDSDDLLDELSKLFEFQPQNPDKKFEMLPTTIRLGAKYDILPMLKGGLLLTHGFGVVPWSEVRASANLALWKAVNLTGAAAVGTFGFSWGMAAAFDMKFLNLFIGIDSLPTRYTPQYLPLGKPNLALSCGLNITF
ncbi:MAG: hypothetical protein IJQ52_06770 [Bacteroidales bacterium]|nr:hypothetical protein [Bacteroidales bacterium]